MQKIQDQCILLPSIIQSSLFLIVVNMSPPTADYTVYEKEFLDRLAYFAVIDNGHSVRQEILIPVQLCVVVEVGCRINTDKQMKEAEKFKLSAKHYRDIVKKMLQKNYVTQTQYAELKSIIGSHQFFVNFHRFSSYS